LGDGFYVDYVGLTAWIKILEADYDNAIPTLTYGGTDYYLPNGAGKTWNQWSRHDDVLHNGHYYINSAAGTRGNYPAAGSILFLLNRTAGIEDVLTLRQYQKEVPAPTS
jgi:hypothetical protein